MFGFGFNFGNTPASGVRYSGEASALFARMATQPDMARKMLIDTTIRALMAAGIWSKLDVLYLFAAHNAQAARLNWIQDNYAATAVSSPSFVIDRGYSSDGAASYLSSNFNPAVAVGAKFQRDSMSAALWSRTSAAMTTSIIGYYDGTKGTTVNPRTTADQFSGRANDGSVLLAVANTDGRGFYAVNRSGPFAEQMFKGGALVASSGAASQALANGALLTHSISGFTFGATEIAAVAFGASLTSVEHAAMYAAIRNYLLAIGATT